MVEVTEATANERIRDLFNKGFTAIERNNFDYAIDVLLVCVEMEPAFLKARKFLRAAAIKRFLAKRGNPAMHHAAAILAGIPDMFKYLLAMQRKRPLKALQSAERLMSKDPLQPVFIRMLGKAAEATDFPEAAIQALTQTREHITQFPSLLHWLGKLYLKTNNTQQALQCFEELVEMNPNDADALKALKDTMAINSMNRDGWEDAARDGFRSAIKDTKESESLEREAKAVKGQKDIEALIEETLAKIEKEPANINYRRALANLYANANRLEEAIEVLETSQTLGTSRDPQIDQNIIQLRIKQFDVGIADAKADDEHEKAQALTEERDRFRFEHTQEMVKRYPNDTALRYDLGIQYYDRQMINEAIQQFQMAQRSPKHRLQAIYYLAMCFKAKKQYDLAIEQLEIADADAVVMDETRKDVLYQLGLILAETDRMERAMECFKKIYQADIGYKDVAQRIESQYET